MSLFNSRINTRVVFTKRPEGDVTADCFAVETKELAQWLADGSLVLEEEILDGIGRYPEALQFMFSGGNLGKLLVKAN